MNNKMKIEVNGKQYTFRFNSSKLQFECNYGYKDNFGQRQSRIIKGKSVDELTENLKSTIRKIEDNNILKETVTLKNFFEFYITNIAPIKNKPSTIRNKINVTKNVPTYIWNSRLCDITTIQLQLMFTSLKEKYSQNTVSLLCEILTTVLNQAVEYGVITTNPLTACSVKHFENGKKNYISLEEIKVLLTFLKNSKRYHHYYCPILFLAFTGCRIGECLGLQKNALDIKNNTVKFKSQISRGIFYDNSLKTKSSFRTIKIPAFVMEEIVANTTDSDFVFTNPKGNYLEYTAFRITMKTIFKKCGLEYRSFKQFRNSYVKTAVLNGVPLKVMQNILGHSKLSTTADIYGELETEDTFYVANKIEQAYRTV